MAATVRVSYYGGNASEPAGAAAEGGTNFNRADSLTATTVIPVPTATGTNYSWKKNLALEPTAGGGSTALSNRKVYIASSLTTGLFLFFKQDATYSQPASGNKPTDSGSNGATPAGYTLATTSAQSYDAVSANATNNTRNGDFCVLVLGVDNTFAGGGGSASLSSIKFDYDEA